MSILGWVTQADQKVALGILVSLVSVGLAMFFGLSSAFQEDTPSVAFEVINEANVLDIRKPLDELTILFQGRDIEESNLNLRILTVRIQNDGEIDILQSHYDENIVWGFRLENGEVLEARLIDGSSNYLRTNVAPKLLDKSTVSFTKVILEKGDFFIVETLALHTKGQLPQIIPIGKVAGVKEIVAVRPRLDGGGPSFASRLFGGNPIIQALRVGIYAIGGFIAFFAVIASVVYVSGFPRRLRARTLASTPSLRRLDEQKRRVILDAFRRREFAGLETLQGRLASQHMLRDHHRLYTAQMHLGSPEIELGYIHEPYFGVPSFHRLVEAGVIQIEDDNITIDQQFVQSLNEILSSSRSELVKRTRG